MRALARAHFYDGLSFYRVIDGFVAQGGIGEDTAATKDHPEGGAGPEEMAAAQGGVRAPASPDHSALHAPRLARSVRARSRPCQGLPGGARSERGRTKTQRMDHPLPRHLRLRARQWRRHGNDGVLHRHRRGAAPARPQSHRLRPRHRGHAICAEAATAAIPGVGRRDPGRGQARQDPVGRASPPICRPSSRIIRSCARPRPPSPNGKRRASIRRRASMCASRRRFSMSAWRRCRRGWLPPG